MGISGTGSLEPGAASGTEFVIRYNDKFLQFYYAANPIELSGMPDSAIPTPGAAETPSQGEDTSPESQVDKAPIFQHLELEHSKLVVSGPRRGQYTLLYKCAPHVLLSQCMVPCPPMAHALNQPTACAAAIAAPLAAASHSVRD